MGHGEAFNSNVLGVSSPGGGGGTRAPFYSQATETETLRPDSWSSKAVFNAIHNAKETSTPPISPQNTRPGGHTDSWPVKRNEGRRIGMGGGIGKWFGRGRQWKVGGPE